MSILSLQKQSQNTDFPNLRPSLDLRFALAKKLDPRITFTRGSTGTYFGPDGLMKTAIANEPRFDHDPITGQSLGLLIEESRQNLLTYSQDFSNAIYGLGSGAISINLITAPDGNTTADAFIENTTSNAYHYFNQFITKAASSITYTFSIFVKSKGNRRVGLRIESGGSGVVGEFNVVSGTVHSNPGTYGSGFSSASSSIVKYPNDWYRVILTVTSNTSTSLFIQLYLVNSITNSSVYTGDGTSGIYIWGAQLEAGAFPTSYIPTTASTVTRSADNASMEGINFSSWFNSNEGSFISSHIQIDVADTTKNHGLFSVSQSGTSNYIRLFSGGGRTPVLSIVKDGTTSVYTLGSIFYSANRLMKTGCSYSSTIASRTINGNTPITDSSVLLPTSPNNIIIGSAPGTGVTYLNGTISRLTYYPIQLTNQQLINLTS